MEKKYESLIENFKDFSLIKDSISLFQRVNFIITKHLGLNHLLAYSLSKKRIHEKKIDYNYSFRAIWPRDFENLNFNELDISEVLAHAYDENWKDSKYLMIEINKIEYIVFFCGEDDHQYYLALTKVIDPANFHQGVFRNMISLIHECFNNILAFKILMTENALVDVDDVTGLYNSRKLHKDLDTCIEKYNKTGQVFAVLFIDIDHFKNVNDGHGHLIGTKILSDMAKMLRYVLRQTDNLYRYGGDEFVIIVPGADTENAKMIGERVLKTVKDKIFGSPLKNKKFKLTVSIGIASYPEDAASSEEVMALADQMMYQAKSEGRGKVVLAKKLFSNLKK